MSSPRLRDMRTAPGAALILRFLLAGLVNAAFGYAVFALCLWGGLGAAAALIIANLAGIAFNFQTARHFVFGTPGRALRFAGLYAVILAVNWLVLRAGARLGVSRYLVQAGMAPVIAGFAFLGQRLFVFDAPPAFGVAAPAAAEPAP